MRDHLDLLTIAMADSGTDVLLLGRPGNARWVTGAESLWLSGTRPFAPGCVVVREPPSVHLLSVTDEGVPADVVPPSNLFPISWNPINLMGALGAIPGLPGATRIGVDSITPMMEQLLGATFPNAELIDGEALLRTVRRVKSSADVDAIRAAVALAEECLRAAVDALTPGVHERDLVGVFEEHMAARGVTTPAFEGTFVVADSASRSLVTERAIAAGDLVHLRAGVLRDGWEGWLSRTAVCGAAPSDPLADRQRRACGAWRAAIDADRDRCRPGTSVGELRGAAVGITVDGIGMGHEELANGDVLEPGVVMAVEATVDEVLGSEAVLVTPAGYELLTTFPHPLA
ncbi:MAG: M24 family metallopeptidase [Acidimicrobiia bacterium]